VGQLVELRSKHVVLTGGAGFIGSHLCDALLDRDNTVTCVDNLVGTAGSTRNVAHVLDDPRFRLVTEDVLDWADRTELTGVDCVFHLAASKNSVALSDPENDLTVNALGTLRLLLRAARDGVSKFVHASTGSVFGDTSREHVEDGPKQPVSVYAAPSKDGRSRSTAQAPRPVRSPRSAMSCGRPCSPRPRTGCGTSTSIAPRASG
jgi:UDP-glucose 4-epimerase